MTSHEIAEAFVLLAEITRDRDSLRTTLERERAEHKTADRQTYRRGYESGYQAGRRRADTLELVA